MTPADCLYPLGVRQDLHKLMRLLFAGFSLLVLAKSQIQVSALTTDSVESGRSYSKILPDLIRVLFSTYDCSICM